MIKRLILALLLLGVVFGGVFGWKVHEIRMQAAMLGHAMPPTTVAATQVRTETWQPKLSAVGSVEAIQGISVTNEIAGTVKEILFDSGQAVSKGEPLLRLDDSVDQAELRGLIAERDLAAIEHRRLSKLLTDKSVSAADVDQARAKLDNAQAQVASKQAQIAKKLITAPFAGRLGIRQVDLGEYLAPGSSIVPLQMLDPVYVDFTLPERHLAELHTDQTVTVAVQAWPGQSFVGKITALNPGIESRSRTLKIRATLPNPDQRLRPGMFAEVRVLLPKQRQVLTLPDTAITYNPYGDAVFIIREDAKGLTVQRRQVETGETRNGRVSILNGLDAGMRVVSAGQVKLRNGMQVTLDDKPAPGERAKAL